jgi:molybdenum cofactor biosynthesis enzyme MoaA
MKAGPRDRLGRATARSPNLGHGPLQLPLPVLHAREVFGRDYQFLPRDEILRLRGDRALPASSSGSGVRKLRITGGEPTVRRGLPDLVAMLAGSATPDGAPLDIAMTTNGSALRRLGRPLADAGLRRVTVSLDSLDDATFRRMNGVDFRSRRCSTASMRRSRPASGR